MPQAELNRAVASATGETVTTIRDFGFWISDPDVIHHATRNRLIWTPWIPAGSTIDQDGAVQCAT